MVTIAIELAHTIGNMCCHNGHSVVDNCVLPDSASTQHRLAHGSRQAANLTLGSRSAMPRIKAWYQRFQDPWVAGYRKPTSQQITQRMLAISAAEGLSLNNAAMTALVASANGDLRLVLGQLQMLRLRAVSLTYDEVKGRDAANKVLCEPNPVRSLIWTEYTAGIAIYYAG